MKLKNTLLKVIPKAIFLFGALMISDNISSQTLAFPEAEGFGRYTTGARGSSNPQIYLVTNLNDSGPGSFRDAVSQEGRFVIFRVGGIINTLSQIVVAKNTTIAGQTATGEGIVLLGAKVTFTGASNTIARYLRIRYGGTSKDQDASGLSNGANLILDHMTFTWGTDEVFSINWDSKGTSPDNITIQNSIIGQGLHRHNHSAGGLMQPSGGKISLIGNLYICNKTRNNKIKGINEFVNNVVYNWGNYGNTYGHSESGEAYIMGGDSAGRSDVNIINNYFIGGPNTSTSTSTPFNRGNDNFYLYGQGNYFDNNRNGVLDGTLVPQDLTGYPTGDINTILSTPYDYPFKNTALSAQEAFDKIVASVGASYPRRDQVDSLMIADLKSIGTKATYVYVQKDLNTKFGFINNGAGHVYGAPAPTDTDNDGMPDNWEDNNGLNKNNASDALTYSNTHPGYFNIEVYINGLTNNVAAEFLIPPSSISFQASTVETPVPASQIIVNWSDNSSNETNFIIERSTNGTTYSQIAELPANTITYTDINLIPNTQYYYRIKAKSNNEFSSYSDIKSVTTPALPSAPAKTTNPTPTDESNFVEPTNGSLVLKWTGSTNTETYQVYFGTSPTELNKVAEFSFNSNPSFNINNLNNDSKYYWRVDASNTKGTIIGDLWSFRTIKNLSEGMVGHWPFKENPGEGKQIVDISNYNNDGILDSDFDNANVRIKGKANQALDFSTSSNNSYMASIPNQDQIYLNKSSFSISFWMNAAAGLLPTSTTSSVYLFCKGSFTKNTSTGATGKRYNLEFKSSELRFAIDDDITKKELKATGSKFFTGNWEHVVLMRDVTAHKLRIYLNGVLESELDETGVTEIAEATDLIIGNIGQLELEAGTAPAPYKGKLDELKIFNYALSANEIANIFTNTVINAPGNLSFQTNSESVPVPTSTVTVNWQDNSNNEANFIIERSIHNISFAAIKEVPANTTTFTDTDLTPETTYYYRIKATNNTDSSDFSETLIVKTLPALNLPTRAINPSPSNNTFLIESPLQNFTLNWTGGNNTSNYSVYFGTDRQNLSKLMDIPYSQNPTLQIPTTLNSLQNYYWRVDAVNSDGITPGETWSFSINGDSDNDNIRDNSDNCPNTPVGETVDSHGCSQSQLDDDNDGIKNNLDLCPNTPSGETVDSNGCLFLPQNNFKIEVIGESCPNKNNGQININATKSLVYTATIDGVSKPFNGLTLLLENLPPKTYEICIEAIGTTTKQCYSAVVPKSTAITGKTIIDSEKVVIEIESGTAPYQISVNGTIQFETNSTNIDMSLKTGDLLTVSTSKACEGVISKIIELNDVVKAFPNPTTGEFELFIPTNENETEIEIYNSEGALISKSTYIIKDKKVHIDLEKEATGIYLIKINSYPSENIKIIKR